MRTMISATALLISIFAQVADAQETTTDPATTSYETMMFGVGTIPSPTIYGAVEFVATTVMAPAPTPTTTVVGTIGPTGSTTTIVTMPPLAPSYTFSVEIWDDPKPLWAGAKTGYDFGWFVSEGSWIVVSCQDGRGPIYATVTGPLGLDLGVNYTSKMLSGTGLGQGGSYKFTGLTALTHYHIRVWTTGPWAETVELDIWTL